MNSTIRRLLFAVVAIAMTLQAHAFKVGDHFSVQNDQYKLDYQITDARESNLSVAVNSTSQTPTDVVIPTEVTDSVNNKFKVVALARFGGSTVKNVTIPEGITQIYASCFSRCYDLTTLSLPATLSSIGEGAFNYCTGLTTITLAENNQSFVVEEGAFYNKEKTNLLFYPSAATSEILTIPSTVTKLSAGSITRNPNLKKIILPDALEAPFDPTAVVDCENLIAYEISENATNYSTKDGLLCNKTGETLVAFPLGKATGADADYTMPNEITTIGKQAFFMNTKLRSIQLSDVTTIEDNAFYRCNGLTEVTIPAATTSISSSAFAEAGKLKNLNVNEGNTVYKSIDGVLLSVDGKTLLTFPVCNKVTDDAAAEKTYTVPEGVETIAASAFQAGNLDKVVLSSSVKRIENSAFSTAKMKSIELNEGLTSIGFQAFLMADNLEEVKIPASVTELAVQAFYRLKNLKKVTIADNSQLTSLNGNVFANNANMTEFVFEGTCKVQTIKQDAFMGCSQLASFEVPASVTSIEAGAFKGLTSLKTITFADNAAITEIGSNAFQQCVALQEITIPNSVKTIKYEAFNSCQSLKTVHIPANTTSIDQGAFVFCGSLTKFEVDAANQQYSCVDGMLTSKDKETLCIFPAGKANDEITLLSPSFKAIGEKAFYYCKKLTNVTIPKHVTKIGKEAFRMCDNLKTIAFLGDTPIDEANIGTNAFKPQNGDKTILENCENFFVRKDNISDYKNHAYWGQWANKMKTSFDNGTEEYFPMSDKAVSLLKTTSTNYTLVVPATVTNAGDGKTYNVSMLGDYAFENASDKIKEVVLLGNINYIGACAFDKTQRNGSQNIDEASTPQQIQNIFFTGRNQASTELSTVRFELNDEGVKALPEFVSGQKIYVRKSVYLNAEDTWGPYKSQLKYQIPLEAVGSELTTLSREFDVDLSENNWDEANHQPYVIAFTSGYRHQVDDYYLVHMESINVNNGEDGVKGNGNGTFIPKNTGVLMRDVSNSGKLTNFTYQIYDGENDLSAADVKDNLMQAVVLNDGKMQTGDYGVGSDNLLHKYTGTLGKKVNVHESYMRLPAEAQGAKLQLTFGDFGETTGIDDVKVAEDTQANDDAYYTLEGVKVAQPTHGIYIHKGKKVVVK